MTIRNFFPPTQPERARSQRGLSGSRIDLANAGGQADAWLEPTLADFISLATSLDRKSVV